MLGQPKAKKGSGEKYNDEITVEERLELGELKVVAIDHNMGDLLYCVDSDQRYQTKFRYTQDMRRKERRSRSTVIYCRRKRKKKNSSMVGV